MAAEIATAQIDSTTVKLALIGAPDLETRHDGWPFISETARVEAWQGRTYVAVTGRAIKVDGDLADKLTRFAAFNLKGCTWFGPAPAWLIEALKAAGVTW